MEYLEKLKTTLCDELEEYARKPEISVGDLETVHKLAGTIKDIEDIATLEDFVGYSRDGNWEAEGRGSGSYERGASYRGGRRSRDSMGRYTSRRYSRADAKEGLRRQIESMMDEAGSQQERDIYSRMVDMMDKL